jgi:hypothetical protein
MKQLETLGQLKPLIQSFPGIQGALLIGSFGRNTPKWNSDVDLSFWVGENFDAQAFIAKAQARFPSILRFGLHAAYRNHLVLYFTDRPKIDISLTDQMEGLDRNFLGSEIPDVEASIVFDPQGVLKAHLHRISEGRVPGGITDSAAQVNLLADKFLFDFEQFSEAHRRSDAYKSYFFYNIALSAAVQIRYLAEGNRAFHFLPKNFATLVLARGEEAAFRQLHGTLYLPEVNELKRRIIDFFLKSLWASEAVEEARMNEITSFCEFIYERDYIWNFRDLADINPQVQPGKLFRASSLTRYQHEPFFPEFLAGKRIEKILDLRDDDELTQNPYDPVRLGSTRHIRLPMDPRQQSDYFKANYHSGSQTEIAYRHFAVECKAQIKQLFEELAEPGDSAAVIHCHAGKDRTGALVTLIHFLSGADESVIQMDYLASEMDSDLEFLQAFQEIVEQAGGIRPYLFSCGITPHTLDAFREKIFDC